MLKRLLASCCVVLALVGCINNNTTGEYDEPAFQVTLKTTDKLGQPATSFAPGDEMTIVLEIKNSSAETKKLSFASSKQYDFVLKNDNDAEVWRWSNSHAFTQALTAYQLAPGESRVITVQWNQVVGEDGTLLAAGDYTLVADSLGIDVAPTQALSITSSIDTSALKSSDVTADFQVTLLTKDLNEQTSTTFVQGDPINLVLSITNISAATQTLSFPSAQQYDFVLKNGSGDEVWRWSNSYAFAGALSSYELAPGETRIITEQWDQVVAEDGTLLATGSYLLEADSIGIEVTPQQIVTITDKVVNVPTDFLVSLKTTNKFEQPSSSFVDGEPINITLTIQNLSAQTQVLSFPSAQQYDFALKTDDGLEVWRWSNSYAFAGALSSYELAPGETRVITEQLDLSAVQISLLGSYVLVAEGIGIDVTPSQIVIITDIDYALPASDFQVTLKTTDASEQLATSFAQGESINIILTIKNISARTKTLSFNDGKLYDFALQNENGVEVWRWSNGYGFTQALTSYTIAPGETRTFTEQWEQRLSESGPLLAPGNYTLQADDFGINVTPQQALIIN